jgi:ABC-type transport system involved in multi-copper enzyme maturation permease subunit
LRSPEGAWGWLLAKEWRELVASRSWWILLLVMGPLVGLSFIGAVRTYADLSGLNGTAAGVGEAFSPLVGVWAPTFSACELAAAFMLPFVAIRIVSGDRQSGALKLELQHPMSSFARMAAKALILVAGWLFASFPPVIAVLLWRSYGGSIYPPELVSVGLGHLLNAALTIALAATAAAITEHPSTAAIVTLTVTVGTWIVNFVAAVQGGIWERAAGYTPTAMVAEFQHGLIRLDVVLVAATLAGLGLTIAAIWTRLGVALQRRTGESIAAGAIAAAVVVLAATFASASWDLSENRANSFSEADEVALKQIHGPLRIEAHLAPEDPRRADLERHAIVKLRRVVPKLEVTYIAATATGLFEQTAAHYGEIWYELGGQRAMSRATTAESVLETIFGLAGVVPPTETDAGIFRGHPLATPPGGAAAIFYGIWPALVVAGAVLTRWRHP